MKVLRNPRINALIISLISAFYAFVFILISEHIEFESILNHAETLNSPFWNECTAFLKQGNIKYFGYAYIVLTLIIVVISLVRKRNYDEYQANILEKAIVTMGIVMLFLFPVALLLILSDHSYSVETIIFLVVTHWSAVLIADLVYVIICGKK